ncbi:putative bifunctional diguanylate cyclase/phosphodiesterase [Vibrio europaeus]|uniref:Diguanylate phosphodiesterase n=1 Tax=Vibrio europaeus TaxID=300876 RepID=A0A178JAY9_9VIBR|nr:EAL domain-containing protein [Vibrio europaeus]MDC5704068.1 EAL domain-containing protein [Vibrio europaeus]MDC5708151.1 EAL domain-containing protein [Vibrio europaeus]MDC5714664.1 EAL domain-containing protein [Vibrio europaeus]MDC5725249.1 EAL domain-containing protein [Vibrio europaeus]MDC5732290.1 EAL domain-containing protein [Vibrio europaeus]
MKLNTRVLLLVAPVILLSAAVSSYSIYFNQKDALIKREQSYLQLSMEKLAGHFRQSMALINSYSLTLTKSDIIHHYFGQPENPYREMKLIENLQTTIENLQPNKQDDIAVAIVDSQHRVRFYADNQNDPFSALDENVRHYVQQTYETTGQMSHTGFAKSYQGQSILIRYDVLDNNTLVSPLSYNKDQVFFIVVSLSLEKFDQLKHILEFDNDSSIFFSEEPIFKSGLTQSVELKSGLYAVLDPAQYLTTEKLAKIEQRLMLSFGVSSLITVLILLVLLYRHVIQPITHLDRQLREVEQRKRSNIERLESDNEIGRLSARFYDMYKELNSSYQKTKAMAENDHLTQLANRYQFQVYVERILANKFNYSHAWILYIDLDNFKYVNDKYGHHVGDSLLVNFAEHIKQLSLESEKKHSIKSLASRLSGDEFAIFIAANKAGTFADTLAQAVLDPIQNHTNASIGSFPITASIGIASYPDDGMDLAKLLSHADTAMYQAKRAGKNQIAHYSKELDEIVRRRTQVERALRKGDLENEFTLLYQPYYDRDGKVIKGVEALLRWNSPKLGKVTPSEFIPISEQIGLFGTIDRWVIKQAFIDFQQLQSCFESPIQLSINLSSAELDSLQLAADIQSLMELYPVQPHLIDFEITETFASDSQSYLLLHELAQMGFKLTIDDFGSGYTSITQLVEYPVQKIKFDREFLETLIKTNNHQVVKPLVDLCHSQSMMVTAEGIESEEMHRWLADNKCDYMQGYHLSPPLSLSQLSFVHIDPKGNLNVGEDGYCSFA